MKNWFKELNTYYKVSLLTSLALVAVILLTSPFYFFSLIEIPNGILVGGLVGIICYLVLGLITNSNKGIKMVVTIIFQIVRYLIIGAAIALTSYLYFKLNMKMFNPLAVMGGYFICLIVLVIVSLKEK